MDELIKKNKKSNLKKIILGSFLGILIGSILGTSIAMFSYNSSSTNGKLVVGDIYMKYKETNNINIENAMPRSSYLEGQYFEFEVTGKNTTTNKDIVYDVVLAYGDEPNDQNRNIRIKDELIRFRLVRVENNTETEIFNDQSYTTINNTRIHKEIISKNTTSEITHKYRLYAWIAYETKIGNTDDADYSIENWNKVFASVKVNVTGDFIDKKVQGVLYDIVKTGAIDDSNIDGNGKYIKFYETNGIDNGNGKFVRSTTMSDQYPIYYYRGDIDNNNVIFANKCWKIVRTTETGGTKMIYNGEIKTNYKGLDENDYTIVTNTGGWTYDSSDNTWNIIITNNDGAEISFKVPSRDGYTLEMTGKTGQASGGNFYYYKDETQVYLGNGGGGVPFAYTYNYGTLTEDNVIKFTYSGVGTETSPVRFKLKMTNPSSEVVEINCNNVGNSTFIASQAWNSSYQSPVYVGYSYGTTAYESSIENWTNGAKFGRSYTWNGTSYKLTDATETTPNATHHYSCNETDANATCSNLRYVYFLDGTKKHYITLQNGKGVEDALKEMLSESTDTIKSPIHETINTWYNTNLKTTYGRYVEDTNWCNDRSIVSMGGWNANGGTVSGNSFATALLFSSYTRYQNPTGTNGIQTTNSPVLTCSNSNDIMNVANGKLDNPVALLTYDETNLAGVVFQSSNSYLVVGKHYWLMSPAYFFNGWSVVGNLVQNYLAAIGVDNTTYGGVRPALSLKHGTLVYDGDGTPNNPYIVGTPIS